MRRVPVVLLAILASTVAYAGSWRTMLSPGPLAPAHQEVDGNCDACHMSFAGIPDDKCLACHEPIAQRITAGEGFHASVSEQECIACHGDHGGSDEALSKPQARKDFSHALTGFSLEGAHASVRCETCHEKPLDDLGDSCGTCHDDAHSSALGPTCASCHGPASWSDGLKTLSAHLLSMEGAHGKAECSDCHLHGANLEGDVPCANCHDDTHGGTATACDQCHEVTGFKPAKFDHGPCTCAFPGKHQTVDCIACHEGFEFTNTPIVCSGCHADDRPHDPIGECSACHTATSWVDNRFDHNKQASFKIQGSHEAVSCSQCHADGQFRGAPSDCASCHQAAGDQAHGDFSSFGGCEKCHAVEGFSPSSFDHGKATGFVLDGQHGQAPCQACHAEKVEGYEAR